MLAVAPVIDPGMVWLALLAGLALVLGVMARDAPRCPRCGCMRFTRSEVLPWVRTCLDCHEKYEVRR